METWQHKAGFVPQLGWNTDSRPLLLALDWWRDTFEVVNRHFVTLLCVFILVLWHRLSSALPKKAC